MGSINLELSLTPNQRLSRTRDGVYRIRPCSLTDPGGLLAICTPSLRGCRECGDKYRVA